MTKPYGVDDDGKPVRFTISAFLVLNNRVVTMAIAILLAIWNKQETMPVAPVSVIYLFIYFCAIWSAFLKC